jgi:acyl carrier protein
MTKNDLKGALAGAMAGDRGMMGGFGAVQADGACALDYGYERGEAPSFADEKARACDQITAFVEEVVGDGVATFLDIKPESRFFQDIEMDSIEIVRLAEKINSYYEGHVDFVTWMSKKSLKNIMGMSIGEVADFIAHAVCSPA